MLLQFDLKHIHKVNFYPSDNNFTQALLVMLVTNIMSEKTILVTDFFSGNLPLVANSRIDCVHYEDHRAFQHHKKRSPE